MSLTFTFTVGVFTTMGTGSFTFGLGQAKGSSTFLISGFLLNAFFMQINGHWKKVINNYCKFLIQ